MPADYPSAAPIPRRRLVLSLIAAATLAAGVLVPASPASAAATVRWVDPAAAASAPGTACGAAAGYTTIASAIAASSAGDTVKVCAGAYTEGKVTVSVADLTLLGAQAGVSAGVGSARATAAAATESSVDVEFTFNKPFVSIDGFTFTSPANAIYAAGVADGGSIVNNRFVGVVGKSISSYGDLVAITGNLFADSGWGVHHDGSTTVGGLVSGNVFRDNSYAISSSAHDLVVSGNVITGIKKRGLSLYGYGNTVSGNTIDMPATATGEGAVTIMSAATTTSVTGNAFTGPGTSVWVGATATGITVERNSLLGTGKAVVRTSGDPYELGANWWGTATGPEADQLTNVTVAAWCADAACTGTLTEAPQAPAAPPAADSDALDDLDLPDSSDEFSSDGELDSLDPAAPLDGELPWGDEDDQWVDVYAYSTPIYLGTFPVVNGRVVLTGVDLSALEAGGHRLVFLGQTSGTVRVVAIKIAAGPRGVLAASGAEAGPLGAAAVLLLGAGIVLFARSRRRVTAD